MDEDGKRAMEAIRRTTLEQIDALKLEREKVERDMGNLKPVELRTELRRHRNYVD